MLRPICEIDLLVDFVAVADELSFRRASERLAIAQPVLSRRIRKLEEQLGFEVFVRTTRYVQLTQKGERLLAPAREVVGNIAAANTLIRSIASAQAQQLRVAIPHYGLNIPERNIVFDDFTAQYPNIRLEAIFGTTSSMLADLEAGALDVICLTSRNNQTVSGLDTLTVCEGGVDVIVSTASPLASRAEIGVADLKSEVIATFPRNLHPDFFDALLGGLGDELRFREFSDLSFSRRLSQGFVAFLPTWLPIRTENIARVPFRHDKAVLSLKIARRRGDDAPAIDRFWRFAKARLSGENSRAARSRARAAAAT